MLNQLSVIMYHYVRDTKKSDFKKLKALDIRNFCEQIDYLDKNYNIISGQELISYILGEQKTIPPNSCLLTFDDGYKDHIDYVLPELVKRNLKACFFPVASTIENHDLLDVNAIQLILAKTDNIEELLINLKNEFLKFKLKELSFDKLWDENAIKGKFDSKEIIFIKRMLQYLLPIQIRREIIFNLFNHYIKQSSKDIAKKIYMSKVNLKCLEENGMLIGNHTYSHQWLGHLNIFDQKREILKALSFIQSINPSNQNWFMCYPYGSYNKDTLDILSKANCLAAFTTKSSKILLKNKKNFFELERYDTNDIKN
tara:strand:+ start:1044 stop:1979 length:936 start_codon:yes stop_codon:yes gene_type:complete